MTRYVVWFTLNVYDNTIQIVSIQKWEDRDEDKYEFCRHTQFTAKDELGAYQAFTKWIGDFRRYTLKEQN